MSWYNPYKFTKDSQSKHKVLPFCFPKALGINPGSVDSAISWSNWMCNGNHNRDYWKCLSGTNVRVSRKFSCNLGVYF